MKKVELLMGKKCLIIVKLSLYFIIGIVTSSPSDFCTENILLILIGATFHLPYQQLGQEIII